MTYDHATSRYGQGIAVDRAQPHWFHRDFWALQHIVEAIDDFLQAYGVDLKGKSVLDYGCGASPYREAFESFGVQYLRADVEPDDPSVLPIDSKTGRVNKPNGSIDAILSTQVLEHVVDVQGYLREAFRLLKPGGRMLLTTHGAFILHRAPIDLRRWTVDGLRHELTTAGFIVEKLAPRIGILAGATHLRAIAIGGLTHRIPLTRWLRPLIYFCANVRMMIEEWLTPKSAMEAHPELLIAIARKPEVSR